jgi:hypothetical protein
MKPLILSLATLLCLEGEVEAIRQRPPTGVGAVGEHRRTC